ncbi:MAG: hypothetical protein ACTSX7_08200 [Alphaproteobacteria bacterium]
MKNPFFGWNTDTLVAAKAWFADIEQTLTNLLQRCQATSVEVVDAHFLLERLEDALSDSRGAIHHLAEAQVEANNNALGYARAVGHALRAAG